MNVHNSSWMKAGFFLLLAGLFASQGSASLPFWNLSAGILSLIAVAYAISGLLPQDHSHGELIPQQIPVRKD